MCATAPVKVKGQPHASPCFTSLLSQDLMFVCNCVHQDGWHIRFWGFHYYDLIKGARLLCSNLWEFYLGPHVYRACMYPQSPSNTYRSFDIQDQNT